MTVFAFLSCEVRSLARMTRTWVVTGATILVGVATWILLSRPSAASYLTIDSRYLVTGVGGIALWTALVGVLVLGFDGRVRDARDGIVECLDVRPYSNVQLIAGRSIAVAFVAWLPVIVVCGTVQVIGVIGEHHGWRTGSSFEPVSLATFVVLHAPIALLLWSAAVGLIATAVRIRMVVAVAGVAVICGTLGLLLHIPLSLKERVFGSGSLGDLASDMVVDFADLNAFVHSVGVLLASASCVTLAGAIYPRLDRVSRLLPVAVGMAFAVASSTVLGLLVGDAIDSIRVREGWVAAHQAQRNDARADLKSIAGQVVVEPGELLRLDVELHLRIPHESDTIVLSLNPGLRVVDIRLDDIRVPFKHKNGFLRVSPQSPPLRTEVTMAIRAAGLPDPRFGNLDSPDPLSKSLSASRLNVLGLESSIFNQGYVALMPSVRWLPSPGSNYVADPTAMVNEDFFTVDLEIDVPHGWLAAGPGPRERVGGDHGRTTYRFRPAIAISDVVVLAAPFARRAIRVSDVELEVLIHPDHVPNLIGFSEAANYHIPQLELTLRALDRYGIPYALESLSLVETPGALRSYSGGWQMRNAMAFPGVVLMREYDVPSRRASRTQNAGSEIASVGELSSLFGSRLTGTNPVFAAARGLLWSQIAASGDGALELEFTLEELLNRIVRIWMSSTESPTGFTANSFVLNGEALLDGNGPMGIALADVERQVVRDPSRKASAWDWLSIQAEFAPVRDHCADELLGATMLRSRAIAAVLIDSFGLEKSARMIGILRERHSGGTVSWADLIDAGHEVDAQIDAVVDGMVRQRSLPAFSASDAGVTRLVDSNDGRPRYQTRVHVRNHGSVPGFVSLQVVPIRYDAFAPSTSRPVRIDGDSAMEIGLLYPHPPESVIIETYLAENRGPLFVHVPPYDTEAAVPSLGLDGHQSSNWEPVWSNWIVVDDLDVDLRASSDSKGGSKTDECSLVDFDAGVPAYSPYQRIGGQWSREASRTSWGRYRRTHVRSEPRNGDQRVTFSTTLPNAGTWTLEYHLPAGVRITTRIDGKPATEGLGTYDMTVTMQDRDARVTFDASDAEEGWNEIGRFELNAGDVDVAVSAVGTLLIADAIRWRSRG